MPNLIHYAIPAFIVLMVIEAILSAVNERDLYELRDTAASLAMGIGNVLLKLVAKAMVLGAYFFVYQFRLFDIGTGWQAWVALFFLEDFTYYWFHRVSHQSRFFWASHVVHHSSRHYNLSTALRQTWTGVFTGFVFWLWLPLLGFSPLMVLTMQSISLLYQFWIHTETIDRLGPLEWIFNTPSHHRVHHGKDIEYLDKNHGGVLIIWDKLFGTFAEEKKRPDYGILHDLETYNPVIIATHEWVNLWRDLRRAPGWKERLFYLFRAPGWSHDGSKQTVRQLQQEKLTTDAVSTN